MGGELVTEVEHPVYSLQANRMRLVFGSSQFPISGASSDPSKVRCSDIHPPPSSAPVFFALLLITFALALGVSALVAKLFDKSIGAILSRIIADDISSAWQRFVRFALIVVGVSGGVRIYQLERYLEEDSPNLSPERWTLEVYRTVIETLQSMAWALLLFFLFALLAYVLVRRGEGRRDSYVSKPLI